MPARRAAAPGNASSHARIVSMLLRLVPRLQAAFSGVPIQLRGDAGFALPLLYQFCEFFGMEFALGIPANCVFKRQAEPLRKKLHCRYRRTRLPPRRGAMLKKHLCSACFVPSLFSASLTRPTYHPTICLIPAIFHFRSVIKQTR